MSSPQIAWDDEAPKAATSAPQIQWDEEQPKRSWLDSVSDFAGELWKQVNPVTGIKGAAQLAAHPIQSYQQDTAQREEIMKKAEEAFKKGDYGAGVSHALYAVIPFLGPQLNEAGEQFQRGEFAKGAGGSIGMGLNLAGPEAIKGANIKLPTGQLPERMYQSALKPSTTLSTGQVRNVVRTGIENEIPVSAVGAAKLDNLVSNLNDAVKAEIQGGTKRGAMIDPQAVAQRADQVKARFANQVTPGSDLAAIDAAKQEFLQNNPNPIPAATAQDMKTGTYQQLKSKAYGELKGATIEAQKALARGIKEELETQFPEIKGLNAQQADLISLNKSLERAVRRIDNHQLLGIGTPIAAGAGGILTGSRAGAGITGLLKLIVDNPEVKSRLAFTLAKASKGKLTMGAASARIAGYTNALGNSVPSDDQGQ